MGKFSDHQKAGGSITTKARELFQTVWSAGDYTASDNALRARGYGQARLMYSSYVRHKIKIDGAEVGNGKRDR